MQWNTEGVPEDGKRVLLAQDFDGRTTYTVGFRYEDRWVDAEYMTVHDVSGWAMIPPFNTMAILDVKATSRDFHSRMMNIKEVVPPQVSFEMSIYYKMGHKDARHAAAEIALEMDRMLADQRATFEEADKKIRELNARIAELENFVRQVPST